MISCQPWSPRGSALSEPTMERERKRIYLSCYKSKQASRQNIWEAISHVTSRRIASRRLYVWESPGSWKPAGCYKQAAGEHMKLKPRRLRWWRCQINDSSSFEWWPPIVSEACHRKYNFLCKVFSFSQHPGFRESCLSTAFFALYEIKRREKTIPSVIPFSSSQAAYCSLNINWQVWASLHFDDCFLYNYLWPTG